jgi:MFS family permease
MPVSESSDAGPRTTGSRLYRGYVLGLLTAVGVAAWVDRNVLAALLQSIKVELALTDTELGLLGGVAFGVFYAALGLPVAWLADRCERRTLIAGALALWSAMTAACGLATGFASLFVARIGVGVGEAGGSPPAVALIAEYFSPARRAFALSVYYLFIPCGFVVGYLSGGWLNDTVGWRQAFLWVGLPGIALALLVRLTLREPPRARPPSVSAGTPGASLRSSLGFFLNHPVLRQIPLGGALHGVGAFAAALWLPTYLIRSFDLSSTAAGAWLALAYGAGGALGVLLGGYAADALVRRTGDQRWYLYCAVGVLVATLPCTVTLYLATSAWVAGMALLVGTFLGHGFLGPVNALMQNLVGAERRAQAAAFYLFLVNLVSMGLGPVLVGALSDALTPRLGGGALRYGLLGVVSVTTALGALHFALAARLMRSAAHVTRVLADGRS